MIKCACGDKECETDFRLDGAKGKSSVYVEMTENRLDGRHCTMCLDANGIVELIRQLQATLREMYMERD